MLFIFPKSHVLYSFQIFDDCLQR